MTPKEVLKSYFGYDSFRPMQNEIIDTILQKKDTLAVMPTGGGKSLCYQVPAMIFTGLTLVISPLIALMQDQASSLQQLGIPALFLNSSLDWDTYKANMFAVSQKKTKTLFLAPESFTAERIINLLSKVSIDLIVIDEAHCISEWGHDFRPEYRELSFLRHHFPKATILALTATATHQVRRDIIENLGMQKGKVFVGSFNRPNIFLEVVPKKEPLMQLLAFLYAHKNESGIVYCFSRKQVDSVTSVLQRDGYNAQRYHAGLSDEERTKNLENFLEDKTKIIVATVAFGMGIDKGNVDFVVHFDLPKSLEQYYQEIGRAGRDGRKAHALLLYSGSDAHKIRYFFQDKTEHQRILAENQLGNMVSFASNSLCRRKFLLSYFGEVENKKKSYCCDVCNGVQTKTSVDITGMAKIFLATVIQTGEKYGAGYLVQILQGDFDERIRENRHHKITAWGKGKNYEKTQWYSLIEQLLDMGFIKKINKYGVLHITNEGKKALLSSEPILVTV